MEPNNKNNSAKIASAIALIIVAVGVIFYAIRNSNQMEEKNESVTGTTETPITEEQSGTQNPVPTPVGTPPATPSTAPTKTSKYKNGTYTASGIYATPEGGEPIDVTLTIKDDVVIDANVVAKAPSNSTSYSFQKKFISEYKQYVVGKNVDSIKLSAISGSSLTPNGFNAALTKIKAQARA